MIAPAGKCLPRKPGLRENLLPQQLHRYLCACPLPFFRTPLLLKSSDPQNLHETPGSAILFPLGPLQHLPFSNPATARMCLQRLLPYVAYGHKQPRPSLRNETSQQAPATDWEERRYLVDPRAGIAPPRAIFMPAPAGPVQAIPFPAAPSVPWDIFQLDIL